MTYYLLSDCTPNNGTIEAKGDAGEIWDAIESAGGLGSDRVVKIDEAHHSIGDRIAVDWDRDQVRDLAAEV